MEEIKDIVQSIVKGCAHGGLQVSEILAAYVARTVSVQLYEKTLRMTCIVQRSLKMMHPLSRLIKI